MNCQRPPKLLQTSGRSKSLRAWVAHGQLFCSLVPKNWDEVGAWGVLLADVARHVSNALTEAKGLKREDSIRRIRELFDAELDQPTDEPSGNYVS